jgi:hypothetical protein
MVLYSPTGGARYRIAQYARFARHLSFVSERDLVTVVDLALCSGQGLRNGSRRTRSSAWVNCIRGDPVFADGYRALDQGRYETLVAGMARTPGARSLPPARHAVLADRVREPGRSACLGATRAQAARQLSRGNGDRERALHGQRSRRDRHGNVAAGVESRAPCHFSFLLQVRGSADARLQGCG